MRHQGVRRSGYGFSTRLLRACPSVEERLGSQKRFAHLRPEQVGEIQRRVDADREALLAAATSASRQTRR
jgi:hypothetical protein